MVALERDSFGQRIKRLREHKGIRQVDLAASAGISWRHLIRIEQDRGGATKPTTVARLADALGVAKADLGVNDDDEEAEQTVSLDDFLRIRVRQIMREEAMA